jgi:hypothetical protein
MRESDQASPASLLARCGLFPWRTYPSASRGAEESVTGAWAAGGRGHEHGRQPERPRVVRGVSGRPRGEA